MSRPRSRTAARSTFAAVGQLISTGSPGSGACVSNPPSRQFGRPIRSPPRRVCSGGRGRSRTVNRTRSPRQKAVGDRARNRARAVGSHPSTIACPPKKVVTSVDITDGRLGACMRSGAATTCQGGPSASAMFWSRSTPTLSDVIAHGLPMPFRRRACAPDTSLQRETCPSTSAVAGIPRGKRLSNP